MVTDRAITLTEPWATLMALGAKKNETRSKPSRYRGWLAVHAAKGWPKQCQQLATIDPHYSAIGGQLALDRMPATLGHVIAVVHVIDCRETALGIAMNDVAPGEQSFGDYSPGRYYYVTDAVRRLREPFPARGFQSIPWRLSTPITEDMLL